MEFKDIDFNKFKIENVNTKKVLGGVVIIIGGSFLPSGYGQVVQIGGFGLLAHEVYNQLKIMSDKSKK